MTQSHVLYRLATLTAGIVLWQMASPAGAQLIKAPLTDGFIRTSSIDISVDEMLGSRKVRQANEAILGPGYPALTIAEIQYKPVRMVRMAVVDPKTSQSSRELVWYMVYRIIQRDYTELAGDGQEDLLKKLSDPEHDPANAQDAVQAAPLMIPRFVLRVDDKGSEREHIDELNLEIQQAVFSREFGKRGSNLRLLNSIEAIGETPDPVKSIGPEADRNPLDKAVYGVAVWRNVDPKTDFFTVFMAGLTNAYRISTDTSGQELVEGKVVQQKFARPGDEFLQDEQEFRVVGQPVWLYRPRNLSLNVPELDSVLRNARANAAGDVE